MFESDVENVQITVEGAIEKSVVVDGAPGVMVTSDQAKFIYWFKNGTQVSAGVPSSSIILTISGNLFGKTNCNLSGKREDDILSF
jgi:hypothetical protein